ncbi:baculoviral IAP repeat-containing protein 7 [Biomphalaria glabrata]|nr:baculoviral IAP repeat-containing protein 7 [Biomphalaria glabrata]
MPFAQNKISLFRRIASYRSLPMISEDFYCTKLAECGYIYTGHELDIECEACKAKTRISESWRETEKYLRHERGCEFQSSTFPDVPKAFTASIVDNRLLQGAGAMGVEGSTSRNSSSLKDDGASGVSRSNVSALEIDGCNETLKAQEARKGSSDDHFVSSATSSHYNIDFETQFQRIKERNSSSSSKSSEARSDSSIEHVDFPHMFISEHLEILKETVNSSGPDCDKNPGHFAYFKINSLQLEQIPSKVRCLEMVKLLKKIGALTARISVQPLNGHRKNDYRQIKLRIGTGFSIMHSKVIKPKDKSKVKSSLKKILTKNKKSIYHIYIHTSRHLVLNDEEAEKTEVEFFSDSADRRDIVILKGSHLMHSTTPGDSQCLLICECSDIGFIEKLDKLQNEFQEAINSLPLKAKKGMLSKLFLVHHPHGGDKVLSYGDYVKVKYKFNPGGSSNQPTLTKLSAQEQVSGDLNVYRKVLFYATDTCPGSCGAPLLTFSRRPSVDSSLVLDIWMHNGVETTHKLGASMIKMCTVEDFYQPPPQSEHPEEDSDDEGSLAKQPVNSPVYKVITTPSYPEHVMFQTRLKSFENWNFHNILQPQTLASLGFFYTGNLDCVRCFQCGLGLRSWKPGDDVLTQHEKYRPTCPYLRSLSKTQENVSTGAVAVPETSNSDIESTTLRLLKAEHTALKQQLTCKVCYKSEIKDVFLPCGELYACSDCSKLLTHCPSCKKQILATITVYLT